MMPSPLPGVECECPADTDTPCQVCCDHGDLDHLMCIYCGRQFEPADFVDEDAWRDR